MLQLSDDMFIDSGHRVPFKVGHVFECVCRSYPCGDDLILLSSADAIRPSKAEALANVSKNTALLIAALILLMDAVGVQ